MPLVGNDFYFSVSVQTQLQCAFVTDIYLSVLSDLVCLIVGVSLLVIIDLSGVWCCWLSHCLVLPTFDLLSSFAHCPALFHCGSFVWLQSASHAPNQVTSATPIQESASVLPTLRALAANAVSLMPTTLTTARGARQGLSAVVLCKGGRDP